MGSRSIEIALCFHNADLYSSTAMANERPALKNQVLIEYGFLMRPLMELANTGTPPTIADFKKAIAATRAGFQGWLSTVREFTTISHDFIYQDEYNSIRRHVAQFIEQLANALNDPSCTPHDWINALRRGLREAEGELNRHLAHVPLDWAPAIFQANTPFTSYRAIKNAICLATTRIHYFDRYLTPQFYDLFLNDIDRAIEVRLVTTGIGVGRVKTVSDLCCKEFTDYQLLELDKKHLHDRNLRVDDVVFSLGPGTDHAGIALTNFGPTDCSAGAHAQFDALITSATVIHAS